MTGLVLQKNVPRRQAGEVIVATRFTGGASGSPAGATIVRSSGGAEERIPVAVGDHLWFAGVEWEVAEIEPTLFSGPIDEATRVNPKATITLREAED
jgi:hypothetical protein